MAQTRFLNYKEDDSTFILNSRLAGILEPGCYRGFDWISPTDTLLLTLTHGGSGFPYVDAQAQPTATRGIIMTKQGTVIMEDGPISVAIETGDPFPRIDLVICNHEHRQVAGGSAAFYSVQRGQSSANPQAPALLQPGSQTIIGYLYLPANAATMQAAGITWTVNRPELSGRKPYQLPTTVAHVNKGQYWEKQQLFSAIALEEFEGGVGLVRKEGGITETPDGEYVTFSQSKGVVFTLTGGGRLFSLYGQSREGQVIHMRFASPTLLVRSRYMQIPSETLQVERGDVAQFLFDDEGSAILINMLLGDTARINHVNRFEATQQFNTGTATFVSFAEPVGERDQAAGIRLDGRGNTYQVAVPSGLNARIAYLTTMPEGAEINLLFLRSGIPNEQVPGLDGLSDFCLEDIRGLGVSPRSGYSAIRFLAQRQGNDAFDRHRLVPQKGGSLVKLVSYGGEWLLISTSDILPIHQHDRQVLNYDPLSGGSGYINVPFTGLPITTLHEYQVPYGCRRDYLCSHTMSIARLAAQLELRVSFYRGEIEERAFAFNPVPTNGLKTVISSSFLFKNMQPREVLQVRIDRVDQTAGQIALYGSTLVLDGTPSLSM